MDNNETKNPIITILENQEAERREWASLSEWNMVRQTRLVEVIEQDGGTVSNYMWDLILGNVNGLRINDSGKVCYLSFYPPSKRILSLLARHNKAIKENLKKIYS